MTELPILAAVLTGSFAVAYVVATAVVVVLDAFGLCYSADREERAHADDPPPRFTSLRHY